MGNDLDGLSQIHEMSASFVKYRGKEFLRQFLTDSGIASDLYSAYLLSVDSETGDRTLAEGDFFEHLLADYEAPYANLMGIAYALGYADHLQGKTYKKLFVAQALDDKQLKLPGVLD